MVITDRALCWLDTNYSNIIGPEIAPSPSLALGAGESLRSTEDFIIYIFVVPGSRIRVDCIIYGNVTTQPLWKYYTVIVATFCRDKCSFGSLLSASCVCLYTFICVVFYLYDYFHVSGSMECEITNTITTVRMPNKNYESEQNCALWQIQRGIWRLSGGTFIIHVYLQCMQESRLKHCTLLFRDMYRLFS